MHTEPWENSISIYQSVCLSAIRRNSPTHMSVNDPSMLQRAVNKCAGGCEQRDKKLTGYCARSPFETEAQVKKKMCLTHFFPKFLFTCALQDLLFDFQLIFYPHVRFFENHGLMHQQFVDEKNR